MSMVCLLRPYYLDYTKMAPFRSVSRRCRSISGLRKYILFVLLCVDLKRGFVFQKISGERFVNVSISLYISAAIFTDFHCTQATRSAASIKQKLRLALRCVLLLTSLKAKQARTKARTKLLDGAQ
jgi:hypothetical protein